MNKKDLVEQLANNEELLGRLYKLYSQRYSDYSDFWRRLSDDEHSHARKIRSFSENDEVEIDSKRFKAKDITDFGKKVSEAIESFEKEQADLLKVLRGALVFENALTEREFFKVFETDSDRVKFYFDEMEESISKHRDRIKKMIDRVK